MKQSPKIFKMLKINLVQLIQKVLSLKILFGIVDKNC